MRDTIMAILYMTLTRRNRKGVGEKKGSALMRGLGSERKPPDEEVGKRPTSARTI